MKKESKKVYTWKYPHQELELKTDPNQLYIE